MLRAKFLVFLVVGLLLVACQPQVLYVQVTAPPQAVPPTSLPQTTANPTLEQQVVEVTRVVTQEVTRVVTKEVVLEVTKSPLGTAARPVQILFPSQYSSVIINSRGQVLADALAAATGLQFSVGVVDSEQALIDLMCAGPADTMGFLPALGYVLAHEACEVQLANTAVSADGRTWQTGMIVIRPNSGITTLADLADKSWAVPDLNSLPTFLYFQALLLDAGIAPGEIVPVQGDNSAMLALFNNEVDFATGTYVPPILPFAEREWVYGQDSPELWRALGIPPTRSPIGYVLVLGEPEFGGYRLRDARAGIFDIEPQIFTATRILTLSAQIPNDTVVLGADFPLGLARQLVAFMVEFGSSEACATSVCAGDFYGWTGMTATEDAFYDPLRFVIETLELTEDEIWAISRQ